MDFKVKILKHTFKEQLKKTVKKTGEQIKSERAKHTYFDVLNKLLADADADGDHANVRLIEVSSAFGADVEFAVHTENTSSGWMVKCDRYHDDFEADYLDGTFNSEEEALEVAAEAISEMMYLSDHSDWARWQHKKLDGAPLL